MSVMTSEIASPYAAALMSIADSKDKVDAISEDIRGLRQLLSESEELREFLGSPLIKGEVKKSVLGRAAEDLDPYTRNFLMLLIDKGRVYFLDDICAEYQARVRERNGTVLAEVTSAIPLSDEQKESVRQKVLAFADANQVELETTVDPELIGGVIIKVGSQVIDASLRGQLRRIGFKLNSTS
ncbi:MAG: ATP synthase F1 subunit delta [Cyanobacteria bacterium P01_A01_bin.135]